MLGEYLLRLVVAAALGAAIGAEREFQDKAAGLRTIMLICVGACLFTIMGQELIVDEGDPTRIPSSIVSGVGFLGAGVIFRRGKRSTGITTAATIWCAAGLGMASGGGRFAIAIIAGVIIFIVLMVLPPLERLIDDQRETKTYSLTTKMGMASIGDLHKMFDDSALKVVDCTHGKKGDLLTTEFEVIGKHRDHTTMIHELVNMAAIENLST